MSGAPRVRTDEPRSRRGTAAEDAARRDDLDVRDVFLKQGSRGPAVALLERVLDLRGFDPGRIDGVFDARTKRALQAFEGEAGIAENGVVGRPTWRALLDKPLPRRDERRSRGDGSEVIEGKRWPKDALGQADRARLAELKENLGKLPDGKAKEVLREAISHYGLRGGADKDNPFSRHFGRNPRVAWCAYFASYAFEKAGAPLGPRGFFGGCTQMAAWLRKNGDFIDRGEGRAKPGDLVFIDFKTKDPKEQYTHVGIVSHVRKDGTILTVEGNIPRGKDKPTGVFSRAWDPDDPRIIGFGRPL